MIKQTILVVMPVYNAEKTLERAIRSILRQRHSDIILTIVDDCSTDSSLEIAKSFLSDSRVSVYQNSKNMGAYYSRNFGIYVNKSRHWQYFTTHDADDTSHPRRYITLLKYLKNNVNGVQDVFARRHLDTNEIIDEQLTMAHALFTKSVFHKIGYFDDVRFGGDWEHWTRLKRHNALDEHTTANCRQVLGDSYIHGNNLTVLIPIGSKKRMAYIKQVLRKVSRVSDKKAPYKDFSPDSGITNKIDK